MRMQAVARTLWKWLAARGYFLITLGILGATGAAGGIVLARFEAKTRVVVGHTLDAVLNSTQHGLSEWMDARQADAQALAHQTVIQQAVRELLATSRVPQLLRQHAAQVTIRGSVESWLRSETYLGVCVIDRTGLILSSTRDQTIGEVAPFVRLRPERLAAVLDGHTSFLPPIWLDPSPSNLAVPQAKALPSVFVLSPIDDESGTIVAALLLRIDLTARFAEILHAARLGNSLEVYAFDKGARLLTETRFDAELMGQGLVPRPMTRMAAQATHLMPGQDVRGYRGFLGKRVLGAWLWNEELEVGIGAEIDEAEALEQVRTSQWLFVGTWSSLAVLALGLTVVVRFGRKRMRRIVASVDSVAERRARERTGELSKQNEVLLQKIEEHRVVESSLRVAQQTLEETSERFARLSQLDALTNLANRRRFDEFLEREWRRSIRYNTPISLVLIDVDYFKLFNDTYGHGAGDDCLREVANLLITAARRPDDLAARLSGEEFALVLCDTDAEGARVIAHHIRAAVENLAIDHELTMVSESDSVTVSIGVATKLPEPSSGPSVLLYHADEALFLAKQDGRNCVRTYEDYTAQSRSTASLRVAAVSLRSHEALGRKP